MNKLFEEALAEQAAPTTSRPRRQAALLLHAMSDTDRTWALAQLGAEQRAQVEPLIHELVAMGVPADPHWLARVSVTPAVPVDAVRGGIAAADAECVLQVLLQEPAGLVRHVLAMGPWPWGGTVLSILRARRGELFEPGEPAELSARHPALDQSVLRHLAARLGVQSAAMQAQKSVGAWVRLRARLQRRELAA
jgi:hypothetical protein